MALICSTPISVIVASSRREAWRSAIFVGFAPNWLGEEFPVLAKKLSPFYDR